MPCDYRILQSPPKRTSKTCPFGDRATVSTRAKKMIVALPKVKTSAKSVQTSAEVSRKYYVLTNLSTRTYENKCA